MFKYFLFVSILLCRPCMTEPTCKVCVNSDMSSACKVCVNSDMSSADVMDHPSQSYNNSCFLLRKRVALDSDLSKLYAEVVRRYDFDLALSGILNPEKRMPAVSLVEQIELYEKERKKTIEMGILVQNLPRLQNIPTKANLMEAFFGREGKSIVHALFWLKSLIHGRQPKSEL